MSENTSKIIGPFRQLLPLSNLPKKGPIKDAALAPVKDAALHIVSGKIAAIDTFETLAGKAKALGAGIHELEYNAIGLPAYVDAHTHACFAGSRAQDYALRNSGVSYLEIAKMGGGIWNSVLKTRAATMEELSNNLKNHLHGFLKQGIGTVEIKSGYGLGVEEELKQLRAIAAVKPSSTQTLVATCLAAHTLPRDFEGSHEAYLSMLLKELLPIVLKEKLATRVDAFVEKSAFGVEQARAYLADARAMGFEITVHADQFTTGGSQLAIDLKAVSADHLEVSGPDEIAALAKSNTVALALPGASLGLGEPFTPVRKLLDAGASVAIASDFNPGSAPMGNLVTQAAILGTYQKVSNAEILAGITYRAAAALSLSNKGSLATGMDADFIIYDTEDFNEILYHQGQMLPASVWLEGRQMF